MGNVLELKRQSIRIFNSKPKHLSAYELVNMIIDKELPISSTEKLALIVLARYTNANRDNGEFLAFPSFKKLSSQMSASTSTAKRAIKNLEKTGFIIKKQRFNEDGNQNETNLYRINFSMLSTY